MASFMGRRRKRYTTHHRRASHGLGSGTINRRRVSRPSQALDTLHFSAEQAPIVAVAIGQYAGPRRVAPAKTCYGQI